MGLSVPIIDPDALIAHHQEGLAKLRESAALTKEDFEAFVMPTLRNLAAFLQLLPSSERDHHSDLGGGFRHAIEVAALAIRDSFARDLTGRAMERRLEVMEGMRVALLLAALLHDCGKPVTDMTVTGVGLDAPAWCPFTETLAEWMYHHGLDNYQIEWAPGRHKKHEAYTGLIGARLLDDAAARFIATRTGVRGMTALWEAAIGQSEAGNVLCDLVKEADNKASLDDLKANRATRTGGEESHRADRFVAIIKENLASLTWRYNLAGGWLWHLDSGFFLTWPIAKEHVLKALSEKGETGYPSDPDVLAEWLIGRGLATRFYQPGRGNRTVWPFAPKIIQTRAGSATLLEGIRIADIELVFGDSVPSNVDTDLWPDIRAGRIQHTGIRIDLKPRGTTEQGAHEGSGGEKADAGGSGIQSSRQDNGKGGGDPPPTQAAPAETGAKEADSKGAGSKGRPRSPGKEDQAPTRTEGRGPGSGAGGGGLPGQVKDASDWLKAETSMGRVILRDVMARLVSRKDKTLEWGRNAALWRDRLVLAWPEAVADMGVEPRSALSALAADGLLYQDSFRGADGLVQEVAVGGEQMKVVAIKEAVTLTLTPLVHHYCVEQAAPAATPAAAPKDKAPKDKATKAAAPARTRNDKPAAGQATAAPESPGAPAAADTPPAHAAPAAPSGAGIASVTAPGPLSDMLRAGRRRCPDPSLREERPCATHCRNNCSRPAWPRRAGSTRWCGKRRSSGAARRRPGRQPTARSSATDRNESSATGPWRPSAVPGCRRMSAWRRRGRSSTTTASPCAMGSPTASSTATRSPASSSSRRCGRSWPAAPWSSSVRGLTATPSCPAPPATRWPRGPRNCSWSTMPAAPRTLRPATATPMPITTPAFRSPTTWCGDWR